MNGLMCTYGHGCGFGGGRIFFFLLIFALVWMLLCRKRCSSFSREHPEEILKKRYAKGEMDADAYKKMLEDLRK